MSVLQKGNKVVKLELMFPIDSHVYYLKENVPQTSRINSVKIDIDTYGDATVLYITDAGYRFTDKDAVFSTMSALINWFTGKACALKII